MKQYALEFLRRGLLACGGGPIILAIIYAIHGGSLSMADAAREILTITLLAFVAGGITMIYQIERLPLFSALLIHGTVLYLDYLTIYLYNGWLASGTVPFVIFTVFFVLGYAVIWACIYWMCVKKTRQLNNAIKNEAG